MSILYDVFIRLYYLGIWLASARNPKAKKWIKGRKNSTNTLLEYKKSLDLANKESIWFHCASVGEFEQGLPLIRRTENEFPQYDILLTFFSPSGYEYAAKHYPHYKISYLPIDTKRNAVFWLEHLKPKAIFFIKYEFWHHYISEAADRNIPLYMVSTVFWKDLFFFKWYGSFFKKSLQQVQHFFVQDLNSKTLLNNQNIQQVSVVGDTRYERVFQLKNEPFEDAIIEQHKNNQKLVIAGSAWNKDIAVIKKIITFLPQDYQVIIAPHEIDNFDYEQFSDFSCSYYTDGAKSAVKILFLNTIGMLSKVYRFADICYIGGGFGKGIHNVLEPAVYNIATLIGPNYQRFREAKQLEQNGLLFVIQQEESTNEVLQKALNVNAECKAANASFFEANVQVSEQIIVFIKKQGVLD